jgi:carbon storage regulator CsrA
VLVLDRRPGDRVIVPGIRMEIEVLSISPSGVRLGFKAPGHVDIFRGEVWQRISFDSWDTGVDGVETQQREDEK